MKNAINTSHENGQNILRLLARRKMLVFGITFLGFSSTALLVQNLKPIYSAKAQIIFDDADIVFIGTQKARLFSVETAQAVILKLKLMNDPEFNVKYTPPKSKFKEINPYEIKFLSLSNEIIAKETQPVIERFSKGLAAQIIPDSSVIDLNYNAKNPQQAAIILNEIIKYYMKSLTPEARAIDNNHEAKIFGELKENANKAQVNFDILKASIKQLKPLERSGDNDYRQAKINYDNAKARLQSLSINSPLMQKLKLKHSTLKHKLNKLSVDYGVKHPKIISLNSQITDIKTQIANERKNIIASIKAEYKQAKARLESLKAPNDNSTKYYNAFMRKKLKILQEQALEAQRIFNDYKAIYQKSLIIKNEPKIPAQILSKVSVSAIPTFPNKPKILAIGTIISFIFGLLLAIFIEKTRNNFLSARQLEEYLNLPCYALIPRVRKDKDKPLAKYVIDNPASGVCEAVRALNLVVKLYADADNKEHKVITVTSSLPNEGKSTLSAWLAQVAVKSGKRVILIDADLRRPSIHKSFGRKNTLSLVEYLSSQNKLEEVIDTNDPSGLHIIYGRSVPNNALDLISSDKMEQLLRSLRKAYDLIIIDSPACMAVSDARALEKLSDQLLYAVSWNKTTRQTVHNGISQFTKFKNAQLATVLTNIDLKKHVQLGYGEAVNYYGSYK